MCGLDKTATQEIKACYDEATSIEKDRAEKAAQDDATAKRLSLANDTIERGQQLIQLLNDPAKFFEKTLDPGSALEKRLFKDPSDAGSLDVDLAGQIYRFAQDYARLGLSSTVNPVIRSIQMAMLEHIGQQFKRIKDEANTIDLQLNAPQVPGVPQKSNKLSGAHPAVDCSIFEDDKASRALLESDGQKWLAMYQACGRNH